jgi:O-methyltransferase
MLKQASKATFVNIAGRLPKIGPWFDKLSCWVQFAKWCIERGKAADEYRAISSQSHSNRYELYASVVKQEGLDAEGIDYLEFGVYRGDSIGWWSEHISASSARFTGFDTFMGLPEQWHKDAPSGTFSTQGKPPIVEDSRVSFEVGMFQESLPEFLRRFRRNKRLVLHLDADLYSSTLFVLTSMASMLRPGDLLFFDEFATPAHEFRAFDDCVKAFGFRYEVVGAVNNFNQVCFKVAWVPGLPSRNIAEERPQPATLQPVTALTRARRKVSVLLPSFNYARYLPKTIESILGQSHNDLELIITDDCSTDGSREIAEEWQRKDDRVLAVFHEVNTGLAGARNSGWAVSSGDFIALCDADDVWAPEKLTIQLERFDRQRGLGVVHSDAIIIDEQGTSRGQKYSELFHSKDQKCAGWLFGEFCIRNFVCNSTVILRRECLDFAGGFDERLRSLEDWLCWARVSRNFCFDYVADPLIEYRIHPVNLSSQYEAMAGYRVRALSLLLEESSDIPPRVMSQMLYSIGMGHKELSQLKAAIGAFRNSTRQDFLNWRSWVRWGQASVAGMLNGRYRTDGSEQRAQ